MSKTKERCGNCKYCFPIKWLRDGKWHYSACCIVFPMTEPDDNKSFAMIVDTESDHCEMYTARGASEFSIATSVTGDRWHELDAVALSVEGKGV